MSFACDTNSDMAPPRTTEGRGQLHAVIDEDLINQVQEIWKESKNPKRWQIVEEIVRLGVEAYMEQPPDHRDGQQDLLQTG